MTAASRPPSSALTSFVVASRYMPVYLAVVLLIIVAWIWAPATLTSAALGAIAPYGTFLAIAALGQMLVIMTGGIDLSVPGIFTFAGLLVVGVAQTDDDRIFIAVVTAVSAAAVIGLLNGLLIGGLNLNPLIVTLAVGSITAGLANRYYTATAVQMQVPPTMYAWASTRTFGLSSIFWTGALITITMVLVFRFTATGRRFQSVGANPVAANVAGLRVNIYRIGAYVIAAVLYAVAGILLAVFLRSPSVTFGAPYLLGPIAAVVIGGASLTGGLASPLSTWVAAFFLASLNQMMRVMGLPTALQFVVFGAVIIGGMLVSGDRIIRAVEHALRERRGGRTRPDPDDRTEPSEADQRMSRRPPVADR